ncbi:MAG: type II secretion system protein [Clostridium sp.]
MKKGFTLIEMIIVVAIITILCSVVFLSSLSTLKTSKVEGFSNEALSLVRKLYDLQLSEGKFVDQVGIMYKGKYDLASTYNILFESEDDDNKNITGITAVLRNKENVIDRVSLSNIISIKDLTITFEEKLLDDNADRLNTIYPREDDGSIDEYMFTFDSKGRVIRSFDDDLDDDDDDDEDLLEIRTIKNARIKFDLSDGGFERVISISTPPSGNIVLEKRGK